jgi:hypothetical protein
MEITQIQMIIIETIYALLVIIPSLLIYYRTRNIFKFSGYKGLRYFSLAFLSIAVAFILRYVVMVNKISYGSILNTISRIDIYSVFMMYFLILPSFFLLYLMFWKRIELIKYFDKNIFLGYINFPLIILSIFPIIIILFDLLIFKIYNISLLIFYISQIIIFLFASIFSYYNYQKKKLRFRQLYFISMVLFFIVWSLNATAQYTLDMFPIIRFYTYIITIFVMFLFLYTTIKLSKKF